MPPMLPVKYPKKIRLRLEVTDGQGKTHIVEYDVEPHGFHFTQKRDVESMYDPLTQTTELVPDDQTQFVMHGTFLPSRSKSE